MPPYREFVGVDGCRGGWIAAAQPSAGRLVYEVFPAFESVLARHSHALILVDVPIGLRDSGPDERRCDLEARRVLEKGRGSSVFPAPVKDALYVAGHGAASELNREKTEGRRGLSRQSWAIGPKIREVNECLAERAGSLPRVREMHPELCFWALNGSRPMQHNKRAEEGYRERIALLSRHLPDAVSFVELVLREHLRKVVRRDDVSTPSSGW